MTTAAVDDLPDAVPALVVVAGLPGTGKSTVSRYLAETYGFVVISTDCKRKQLAGLPVDAVGEHIYTPDWSDRVYAACAAEAAEVVRAGGRAVVDGTFREHARREAMRALAVTLGVRLRIIVCEAPRDEAHARLRARPKAASDADIEVYERLRHAWEPLPPHVGPWVSRLDTSGRPEQAFVGATQMLQGAVLA